MILYIANIGNRDIQDENGYIKRCRSVGKEHLEAYESVKEKLTFPIIRTGLEHILAARGKVDRVVLFYTDQDREQAGKNWESDTLWFARLLERLIPATFGDKVSDIKTIPIKQPPHDYDAMFNTFNDALGDIDITMKDDVVYLSPAGGTPACNMALMYRSIQAFEGQARLLLITENRPVREMKVGLTILGDFQRQLCYGLLDKYDFSSLSAILPQMEISSGIANLLARYFHQRITMDYTAALNTAEDLVVAYNRAPQALQNSVEKLFPYNSWQNPKEYFNSLREDLVMFCRLVERPTNQKMSSLIPNQATEKWQLWHLVQQGRIAELWLNAWLKWETGQDTDFLARLYRINEAILQYIFESQAHYSVMREGAVYPDFYAYLVNDENGKIFCEFLGHEHTKKPYEPGAAVLKKYLSWLCRRLGHEKLRPVKELLDRTGDHNTIIKLRNNSIIAHGYEAVTRDKIVQTYGGHDLKADLREVLELLEIADHTPRVILARDIIMADMDTGS